MTRKQCNYQPVCEICNKSVLHLKYKHGNRYPRTCSATCKGQLISTAVGPGSYERAAKAAATKRSVLPSGITVAQAAARKASETMERSGARKVAAEKRKAKMQFGTSFGNKVRAGMMKVGADGLTAAERGGRAARKTLIEKGVFVDPAKQSEWYRYSRRVRYLTSKQPLHLLENIDKRGPVDLGGWHLDHIVSVRAGFEKGIPAEEIANISNLRMLPAIANIKKGAR